jgi:hypothetical protein
MNIADHPETASLGRQRTIRWMCFSVLLVCIACGTGGCADQYYSGYPGYGPRYAGYSPGYGYGPGYGYPRYGYPGYGYPGSVTVEIGDRPYYTRGAGYYVGRDYYVWKPGHWVVRNGRKVWIHGHYVLRRR